MMVDSLPDHMPKRFSTERVSIVRILSTSIFNNECSGRKGMLAVLSSTMTACRSWMLECCNEWCWCPNSGLLFGCLRRLRVGGSRLIASSRSASQSGDESNCVGCRSHQRSISQASRVDSRDGVKGEVGCVLGQRVDRLGVRGVGTGQEVNGRSAGFVLLAMETARTGVGRDGGAARLDAKMEAPRNLEPVPAKKPKLL